MNEKQLTEALERIAGVSILHIFMSVSYFAHLYERKFKDFPSVEETVLALEQAYKNVQIVEDETGISIELSPLIKPALYMSQIRPPVIQITEDNKVKSIEIHFEYVLPEVSKFIESYIENQKLGIN